MIGCKLVPHRGSQLVLTSVTLNDLERRNDRRHALSLRQLSFLFKLFSYKCVYKRFYCYFVTTAVDFSTYCIYLILAYLAVLLRLAEVLSLLELHELQMMVRGSVMNRTRLPYYGYVAVPHMVKAGHIPPLSGLQEHCAMYWFIIKSCEAIIIEADGNRTFSGKVSELQNL